MNDIYRQQNREDIKDKWLQKAYGISLIDWYNIRIEQGNCCAICTFDFGKNTKIIHLDHDHVTGKIRGLLCSKCNKALGLFQDNSNIITKAAEYLLAHKD